MLSMSDLPCCVPVYYGRFSTLPETWTFVSPEDYERLMMHRWYRTRRYVTRIISLPSVGSKKKRKLIFLHREVLGLSPDDPMQGDHINGDELDNRRENLRLATQAQNTQNHMRLMSGKISQYRGVSFDKNTGRWFAQVKLNNHLHYLGRFHSEDAAASIAASFRADFMPFSEEARLPATQ